MARPAPPIIGVAPKSKDEALEILGAENVDLRAHIEAEALGKNACAAAHKQDAER
jgi:hypothetical protein